MAAAGGILPRKAYAWCYKHVGAEAHQQQDKTMKIAPRQLALSFNDLGQCTATRSTLLMTY